VGGAMIRKEGQVEKGSTAGRLKSLNMITGGLNLSDLIFNFR
jgi:hypothetical protein